MELLHGKLDQVPKEIDVVNAWPMQSFRPATNTEKFKEVLAALQSQKPDLGVPSVWQDQACMRPVGRFRSWKEHKSRNLNTGIWCLIIVLKLAWRSPLTGGGFHLANTELQVERSCAEPGVDVKDGEQNQGGRWDHLPHLLLVHVVEFVVGHLVHGVLHLLLDVGVLRQHSIDTLASVVPSQQVRAPENDMPDNSSRKWKIQTRYLKCWTTVTAPATTRGARMQVKRMWMA